MVNDPTRTLVHAPQPAPAPSGLGAGIGRRPWAIMGPMSPIPGNPCVRRWFCPLTQEKHAWCNTATAKPTGRLCAALRAWPPTNSARLHVRGAPTCPTTNAASPRTVRWHPRRAARAEGAWRRRPAASRRTVRWLPRPAAGGGACRGGGAASPKTATATALRTDERCWADGAEKQLGRGLLLGPIGVLRCLLYAASPIGAHVVVLTGAGLPVAILPGIVAEGWLRLDDAGLVAAELGIVLQGGPG